VWEEIGLQVELVGPAGWVKSDGIKNKDLVPPLFVNRHPITDSHDHSAFIFVAKATSRETSPQSQSDAQSDAECIWVTKEELDNLQETDERMGHDTYRYAVAALDLVNGL
jgi:hypothetical protein